MILKIKDMNNILKNGLIVLMVALLASCSAKQEEMVIKSPEGKMQFKFKANKPTSFDPWDVTMSISGYEKERSLTLDMYSSDFNSETVVVDWKDENSCVVTLKQTDGDNRVMDVYLSDKEVRLQERGGKELDLINPLLNL